MNSKPQKKPWLLPTLATAVMIVLTLHKSQHPVVFNRYSVGFTISLLLCAVAVGLLWRQAVLRAYYEDAVTRISQPVLALMIVLALPLTFIYDLVIDRSLIVRSSFILLLVAGIVIQIRTLWERLIPFLGPLALFAWSTVVSVVLIESIFTFFLLQTQTPKTHRQFLQIVSPRWPQPVPVAKPENTVRISGLGASIGVFGGTMDYDYPSNYHYVLEEMLRRESAAKIEMLNVSVAGYDLKNVLAILRFGMDYSPDLVIHGFFVGSDFSMAGDEIYTFLNIEARKRQGHSRYWPHNFLARQWAKNAVRFFKEENQQRHELSIGVANGEGVFSKKSFFGRQVARLRTWGRQSDANIDEMKRVFHVLDLIRSRVAERGAQYVMVIHPDQTQIYETLRKEILTMGELREDEYDFDLPQKLLRSYCVENGVTCLDLLPVFRGEAKDRNLYLPRDTHYNTAGHHLAAATISQFLCEKQLFPSSSHGHKCSISLNDEVRHTKHRLP
jgi:hypothetical protein